MAKTATGSGRPVSSQREKLQRERKVNILLVDDQPANLLALEAILGELGHNLVKAGSGEEALRHLLDTEFAAVLLDVQMGGLDGFETAKLIRGREKLRHTPIIFLTAYDSNRLPVEEAYALGAVDYLIKPLVPVILRAKVIGFVELFDKAEQVKRQAEQIRQMDRREFEEKLAQENARLRESEQRFARFMQHLPGLAWIKDLEGRYVYVNDAAEKAFRMSAADLHGKKDAEIFPPEVARAFMENDARALGSGTGVLVIEGLEHEDGLLHPSIVSKFPILGPDGKAALVGGMAIDITDRVKAEEALRDQTRLLTTITDNADSALVMIDTLGHFTFQNPAFHRITGYVDEDTRGQRFHDVVHRTYADGTPFPIEKCPIDASYKSKQPLRAHQDVFLRKDGTLFPVVVSVAPLDKDGAIVGAVVEFRDVTREKASEESLKEADRRKDEFLAMLAHELRNPLAPVRTGLHILRLRASDLATVEHVRDMMDRQIANMSRLVDDLLDVSRITRGKIALKPERVDLAQLVRLGADDHREDLRAKGLSVNLDLPPAPVWVVGDPTRLTQIFDNLIGNAAKFSNTGGPIHVAVGVDKPGRRAFFGVRDTGIGIEPAMLARLFDAFAQADRSLDRSAGGLGLGLSIVKGLVELHGGTVAGESAGLGHGARFTVWLPCESEPAAFAGTLAEAGERSPSHSHR